MEIEVDVPNGKSGDWEVLEFHVTESEAQIFNMQQLFSGFSRPIYPGSYKKLIRGKLCIMSNTPAEVKDHVEFIYQARKSEHILINGLGLGVALKAILESEQILSVTVIERSSDVIKLVASSFDDDRVTIIEADAFEWKPPKGKRYGAVWHDIWDDISTDNIDEMSKLHRKYGRRADWQGSWCKSTCLRRRREENEWCW